LAYTLQSERRFPCQLCPLLRQPNYRKFGKKELEFVAGFKRGELTVDRGATVLGEGTRNPHLYTVLTGWGFRYKLLADGRRQIVNYVLLGDLIGLQGSLMGEMQHSVETLSPMILCVFERGQLMSLYREHPELGYDLTWLASREESILDEHLLSVGRRTAMERLSYLIAFLVDRARAAGIVDGSSPTLPITQTHVADTLGLSLVHTNKTIRKLADRKLLRWAERGCEVIDGDGLAQLARWEGNREWIRPFL